ncbi:MAG: hypothetical protein MJ154_00620 [Candidatus Saccharibacteria bacterium]|nr:hypothetical protein [Candidatus Saccharibacteria bacterium]
MEIRNKYPEFIFESYQFERNINGIHASFVYKLGEYTFEPTVDIPIASIRNEYLKNEILDNLFFNFGIINAINYYKLSLAPKFTIKCGELDVVQKEFFKKLFYNGLGELMYRNNMLMQYADFMTIDAPEPAEKKQFYFDDNFAGNLITVGGGKDSIVSLEALGFMREQNLCMQFNRSLYPVNRAALDGISLAGYGLDSICNFNLSIDEQILELNQTGQFFNGHVPFSGMLAFACAIICYLNNIKYIVVSNEASANEGNIAGTTINHQYSKSYEFERDFETYLQTYLCEKIHYFSLLRSMNEFQIVQKFIKFPSYLKAFRSCNVGTKTNSWCGHCAKCMYVYIMLYPFVAKDRLIEIFGRDLLDDESMGQIFYSLIAPDTTKPFECVGTREEINYSIKIAIESEDAPKPLPKLLQWYYKSYSYNPTVQYTVPQYYNSQHNIPEEYLKALYAL